MEFSYETSPALGKLAARRFIWRHSGIGLIITAAIAFFLTYVLIKGHREVGYVILATVTWVILLHWSRYYLCSDGAFKTMPDPKVTVRVADEAIEFETSEQLSRYRWNRIATLWKFRDVWLIFSHGGGSFVVIPAEALSPECARVIEKRIRNSGGSVK